MKFLNKKNIPIELIPTILMLEESSKKKGSCLICNKSISDSIKQFKKGNVRDNDGFWYCPEHNLKRKGK